MSVVWKYPTPLEDGVLLRRYKRFLADVRMADGRELTVHCANPGSMKTCCEAGRPIRVSDSRNPKRKLRYSLEQIRMGQAWIAIHTAHPNHVVAALLERGEPLPFPTVPFDLEVPDGNGSRFDARLQSDPPHWIEVKNVTLREGREARFPDSVTVRGRKHLEGLIDRVSAGEQASMVFYVARADVQAFRAAWDIDPEYAKTLRRAAHAGVGVVAVRAHVTRSGLGARNLLPVRLDPPGAPVHSPTA